jgi:acyl-CoA dehydrogenase
MSEVGELLRATADRLFDAHCTQDLRARAEAGEWPEALWTRIGEAGLDMAAVPESLGGSEAPLQDVAVIMRAAGWHALPLPLVETVLGNWLLGQAGQRPAIGPVALLDAGGQPSLTLSPKDGHSVVTGCATCVPWAGQAARIVAVAQDADGRQAVVQLPVSACAIRRSVNQAGEPRDDVVVAAVPVGSTFVASGAQRDFAAMLLQIGALARGQQMAGAMEWILHRSCAYALERNQFGKPIGAFQAVRHMAAVMATQVSAACVAAEAALAAFTLDVADPAIGYAKARIGEAAGEVTALTHQLHGAMGYSHEYALHWRTRRLLAWRDEFGSERFWNLRAGKRLAERGATNFWSDLAT